jgi:chemotaxis protein CheD
MIAPPRAAAIPVGLAAIGVSSDAECQLVAHGVGSCVIVCAWDPVSRIAGMAHVVQPQSPAAAPADTARYADRAVPALLARMRAAGADPTRLLVKLVGGASVLRPPIGGSEPLGLLNIRAVEAALAKQGIRPQASDVGGTHGRTAPFAAATGRLHVKTLGLGEKTL